MTYRYGVNAFQLTRGQLTALAANLPKLEAQDRIRDGRIDTTGDDFGANIEDLYLTAYEDKTLAARMRTEFLSKLVKASCDAALQNS